MRRAKRPSFSLVELLIAALILGAPAAIAIPKIIVSTQATMINTYKNNIRIINNQIELFHIKRGSWPSNPKDDILENTDYLPDGEPIYPITGETYPNNLLSANKVDASGHNH